MGAYLLIFWGIYAFMLLVYLILRFVKRQNKMDEGKFLLLSIIAWSFLFMSFITKDPIFAPLGVPAEYEWLAGLVLSGFSAWQFYFNPLKERVIKFENSFAKFAGISTTNFGNINKTLDEIKEEMRDMKQEIRDKT